MGNKILFDVNELRAYADARGWPTGNAEPLPIPEEAPPCGWENAWDKNQVADFLNIAPSTVLRAARIYNSTRGLKSYRFADIHFFDPEEVREYNRAFYGGSS